MNKARVTAVFVQRLLSIALGASFDRHRRIPYSLAKVDPEIKASPKEASTACGPQNARILAAKLHERKSHAHVHACAACGEPELHDFWLVLAPQAALRLYKCRLYDCSVPTFILPHPKSRSRSRVEGSREPMARAHLRLLLGDPDFELRPVSHLIPEEVMLPEYKP